MISFVYKKENLALFYNQEGIPKVGSTLLVDLNALLLGRYLCTYFLKTILSLCSQALSMMDSSVALNRIFHGLIGMPEHIIE